MKLDKPNPKAQPIPAHPSCTSQSPAFLPSSSSSPTSSHLPCWVWGRMSCPSLALRCLIHLSYLWGSPPPLCPTTPLLFATEEPGEVSQTPSHANLGNG